MSNIWYDYQPIDSYKRPLNIIVGERGVGKTYGAKCKAFKLWIEKKQTTVWVRRNAEELRKTKETFLADIKFESFTQGKEFFVKGFTLYERVDPTSKSPLGIPVIHFLSLSTYEHFKSASYHNTGLLVFDEFLTKERHLEQEIFKFFDICETVFRHRSGKIYLLGNSLSQCNPYFDNYGIKITGSRFQKSDIWVLENCNSVEFRKFKKTTMVAQLTQGSAFENYAQNNEFILDDFTNVCDYKGEKKYMYNLKLHGLDIGVYNCNNMYYFAEPMEGRTYTIYVDDCMNGAHILNTKAVIIKSIAKRFMSNFIMFKDIKIKNEIVLLSRMFVRNY